MQPGVLEAVERACQQSAATTNLEMKRGVGTLAAIASTAPFIGILGMLGGTPQVLKDILHPCGECAGGPAELFVFPAIGLVVASAAMLLHGVLSDWGEHFRIEMIAGTLQLMNDLVRPSTNI